MKQILLLLSLCSVFCNAQSLNYDLNGDGKEDVGDVTWLVEYLKEKDNHGTEAGTTPKVEHEYVDMGLSVKWATCNVGANKPEEYGDYFAWGETIGYNSGRTNFRESTYKFFKSTTSKSYDGYDIVTRGYTKYVSSAESEPRGYNDFCDEKIILEPEDDAASVNWSEEWRMPTCEEMHELVTKCKWEWAYLNQIIGYKIVAENGNSIFSRRLDILIVIIF